MAVFGSRRTATSTFIQLLSSAVTLTWHASKYKVITKFPSAGSRHPMIVLPPGGRCRKAMRPLGCRSNSVTELHQRCILNWKYWWALIVGRDTDWLTFCLTVTDRPWIEWLKNRLTPRLSSSLSPPPPPPPPPHRLLPSLQRQRQAL